MITQTRQQRRADEQREIAKRLGVIPAGRCACGVKIPPGRKWTCRDDCDGTPIQAHVE